MHWRVCLRMRPHCSHFRMRPQTANAAICGCRRVPERNCKCICVHTSAQCNQQYMVMYCSTAGMHNYHHAMLQYQFHHVFLELCKERLTGVFHEWNSQLQYPRHIVQQHHVLLRLTQYNQHIHIRLPCLQVNYCSFNTQTTLST